MAAPLSAASFISALRAEGLTVVEVGNWRTHNRNSKGSWGPMNGVMVHHTVTKGTPSTVQLCKDGHSTLPGPLCHGVIGKDGRVYLVGYGRANHAGGGDLDVLNAVIAESYATNPPATHKGKATRVRPTEIHASTASSAKTSATATTPGPPPRSRPSPAPPPPYAAPTAGAPSP